MSLWPPGRVPTCHICCASIQVTENRAILLRLSAIMLLQTIFAELSAIVTRCRRVSSLFVLWESS